MPLPVELLYEIIDFIHDKHDLLNLSLSNHTVFVIAERRLYHSLFFDRHPKPLSKTIGLCLQLLRKPYLFRYVRVLTFAFYDFGVMNFLAVRDVQFSWVMATGYMRLLCKTLSKMLRLHSLIFSEGGSNRASKLGLQSLIHCCPSRLQILNMVQHNSKDLPRMLLERLSLLEELRFGLPAALGITRSGLPHSTIPKLQKLGTDWSSAMAIAPMRPVRVLEIGSNPLQLADLHMGLPRLALAGTNLQSLQIPLLWFELDAFILLALHLPNLVELKIHCNDDQGIEEICRPHAQNNTTRFPSFRHLHTFTLDTNEIGDGSLSTNDYVQMLSHMALTCPALAQFILSSYRFGTMTSESVHYTKCRTLNTWEIQLKC